MALKPLEDRVVLKPFVEDEKVSSSGLIIQSTQKNIPSEGTVVAIGPGLKLPDGDFIEIDLKVGDKVAYSKFSGVEVTDEGVDYIILPYRDILAVLG